MKAERLSIRPLLYTTQYEYGIEAAMKYVRRDNGIHAYAKLLLKRRSPAESSVGQGGWRMAVGYADNNPPAIEVLLLIQPNEDDGIAWGSEAGSF